MVGNPPLTVDNGGESCYTLEYRPTAVARGGGVIALYLISIKLVTKKPPILCDFYVVDLEPQFML